MCWHVQVELMVAKNEALLAKKAELKRKAELAEQTEQELAKRSQVFQKSIKNLVRPACPRHKLHGPSTNSMERPACTRHALPAKA